MRVVINSSKAIECAAAAAVNYDPADGVWEITMLRRRCVSAPMPRSGAGCRWAGRPYQCEGSGHAGSPSLPARYSCESKTALRKSLERRNTYSPFGKLGETNGRKRKRNEPKKIKLLPSRLPRVAGSRAGAGSWLLIFWCVYFQDFFLLYTFTH